MWRNEEINSNKKIPTKIIESSDIEFVKNNPGAIYKSRPLSNMIYSAMSLKDSRSRSINLELDTRKFEESLVVKDNNNNDYLTKEFELDI
ncbi:unnamed protein product [Rhizophagus irregularis]|nr:unnamed protein product [Rhizophagus irregularis]